MPRTRFERQELQNGVGPHATDRALKFALRYDPDPNQQRRGKHGKPIQESRPPRRAFNTPNAAGVSRNAHAGPGCHPGPTA